MKRVRCLGGNFAESDIALLSRYKIDIDRRKYFNWVEIEDGEQYFKIFNQLSDTFRQTCININKVLSDQNVVFKYSIDDIKNSEYCVFNNVLVGGGYPEPSYNFEYEHITYAGMMCNMCNIPKVQMDNFQVSKISRKRLWGFTAWEKDVIFVKSDFYETFFRPLGLDYRPIKKNRSEVLDEDVQLELPIISDSLDLSYNDYMICPCCKEKKYCYNSRYPYFPIHKQPLPYIYLTKEYFGTGREAEHRIIISTLLALKLVEMKLIPLYSLIPCRKDLNEYLSRNPGIIIPGIINADYPYCEKR